MSELTPIAEAVWEELHARLGPSNKRWPYCTASPREEERYPDIAGEAAIDGTGSHLLLELCMKNNVSAIQYDQQIIGANHHDNPGGWMVDPARCKRVQMALDYITRRVTELKVQFPGCNVLVESETKSNPGGAFGRDDWWGTCDITIMARHPMSGEVYFIEVADYKDGRGYVSEKNNTQNISYWFGKARNYIGAGPDKCRPFTSNRVGGCRMTIIQPKTNPVVRYEDSLRGDVTVSAVIESAEELATAAHKTDDPNAPCTPGDHCQWCKANPKRGGHCTAKVDQSMEVMNNMSTEIATDSDVALSFLDYIGKAVGDPKSLTVEELYQLADAEAGFQAAFNKVKTEIQERIEQGISVPGYAMLPGKGSRVYNEDEETIVKKLKGRKLKNVDIFPPKLITPAALMKLDILTDDQKKRLEKEIITFKAGKLSLQKVAHDHKDPKVVGQSGTDDINSVEMMFASVPKPVDTPTEKEVHESQEISFF